MKPQPAAEHRVAEAQAQARRRQRRLVNLQAEAQHRAGLHDLQEMLDKQRQWTEEPRNR